MMKEISAMETAPRGLAKNASAALGQSSTVRSRLVLSTTVGHKNAASALFKTRASRT